MRTMIQILPLLAVAFAVAACERAESPTPEPAVSTTVPVITPVDEAAVATAEDEARIAAILLGEHRSTEHRARDQYRNPAATLEFFGLRADSTVVEIWPGDGWYTEIIAPSVNEQGQYYGAHFDPGSEREFVQRAVAAFQEKLAARPDLYGNAQVTALACPPEGLEIAPAESVDLVLAFRSLHNWMGGECVEEVLATIKRALKPGGTFGLVGHRAPADAPQDPRAPRGYVREDYAIELIESAGFELVASSEANANPRDPADHERGVWVLPPRLARGDEERERYLEIGESDRFTLKFRKPE